MQAQIDEEHFEIVDISDPEECGHVALQDPFHNIFTQQPLAEIDVFLVGGFRKTANQEMRP